MDQKNGVIDNLVRLKVVDRRNTRRSEPPYITDEGFVLVDRRGEEGQPLVSASSSLFPSDAEAALS